MIGRCGESVLTWNTSKSLFPLSHRSVNLNISFTAIEDEPWDKLQPANFHQGETFTTFRAYSPRKDRYYSDALGKEFYVIYNGHAVGKAKLIKREYRWSDELTLEEIKSDTFSHWTRLQFEDMMFKFYENRKIFGFWLTFKITKVGANIKTLDLFVGEEKMDKRANKTITR